MANQHFFTIVDTQLGDLAITGDGLSITGLYNREHSSFPKALKGVRDDALFKQARLQLSEYFEGVRREFELPLKAAGTHFQREVWRALGSIPYGETRSYGEVGSSIDRAKAYRAVGSANGCNPIMIIVPCHRVIAASGAISGYAGGEQAKRWLLQHEQSNR